LNCVLDTVSPASFLSFLSATSFFSSVTQLQSPLSLAFHILSQSYIFPKFWVCDVCRQHTCLFFLSHVDLSKSGRHDVQRLVRVGVVIKRFQGNTTHFHPLFSTLQYDTTQKGKQADTRRFERKPKQKNHPRTQIRAVIVENPRRSQLLQVGK
jgi:hypothetical protein